ncbi:DUF7504 family protein [Halorientalis salina]|uniref:DUF7504 family protein n=1 Tax=Halorientalis salina TaxID=2932266 RepID=UPI0010ABDCEF|nr:hypothetical protein [Halorientalis salina]
METKQSGDATHGLDLSRDGFDNGNVLVLAPVFHPQQREECLSLTGGEAAPPTDVLYFSFTRSIGRTIERWTDSPSDVPERFGVIRVNDSFSVGQPDSAEEYPTDSPVTVKNTSLPPDLTGLGIAFGEFLDTWVSDDRHLSICFDSVTALLQYEETDRVCQFLQELTRRVTALDADAHYHLDPGAHDEKTINKLAGYFDRVVEIPDADTDLE